MDIIKGIEGTRIIPTPEEKFTGVDNAAHEETKHKVSHFEFNPQRREHARKSFGREQKKQIEGR